MGGSILMDEDELVGQRLIAATLKRAGYKVTRARSLGVVPRLPGAGAMSARCRSSMTVTPGQNSRAPV